MNTVGIVQLPSPVLREKCADVTDFEEFDSGLAGRLYGACRDSGRYGVAAPQIGVPVRAFAASLSKSPYPMVLANPTVTSSWGSEVATEGCLSIADQWYVIERAATVNVVAYTRTGRKVEMYARGTDARVLQHEIDHLDGVLIVDRANA